ncbi:MAG: hypothetical protein WBW16_13510 [Bacteroidota bacterium]
MEDNIRLGGEIGAYGELYSMKGQAARRPSSTGRLFFRPSVTFFNSLSLNFDFLLSTEGSNARQDINQLGINPTWSWGRAHAGDFSESFSPLTLSGILVRGGGITINPGNFRLSAVGGFTKRAVAGGAESGAYDRYLYAGKIGVGREEGSFFDLVFLRARDKGSSLHQLTTPSSTDSLNPAMPPPQPYEITPQENLVVGAIANFSLLDDHLTWRTEADGSLFTRDMGGRADTTIKLPDFVKSVYKPNLSSNVDLAVSSEMNLNLPSVGMRAAYRYVGPGYASLGVGTLLNDLQEFFFSPTVRFTGGSISLDWLRQNDNLAHQKLFTQVRNTYDGNLGFQGTRNWYLSFMGSYTAAANNSTNDTTKVDFKNLLLGTSQTLTFEQGSILQNISAYFSYQHSGDDSPLRTNTKSITRSLTLSGTVPVSQAFAVTPSFGLQSTSFSQRATLQVQSYSVSLQHRALENRLTTVFSFGGSFTNDNNNSYRTGLTSNYLLTSADIVSASVFMTNFRGQGSSGKFDETVASINITHRF